MTKEYSFEDALRSALKGIASKQGQTALAEKLGIQQGSVSEFLNGKRGVGGKLISGVADAYPEILWSCLFPANASDHRRGFAKIHQALGHLCFEDPENSVRYASSVGTIKDPAELSVSDVAAIIWQNAAERFEVKFPDLIPVIRARLEGEASSSHVRGKTEESGSEFLKKKAKF